MGINTLFQYGDEQFRCVELSNNQVIILSSLDSTSIGENTSIGSDYTLKAGINIYSESTVLCNTFKAKEMVIVSHEITADNGVLTVSGSDGDSALQPVSDSSIGQDGGNGNSGGILRYCIENLSTENLPLKFEAKGGNGGRGQSGPQATKGGNGGNGGDGGEVYITGISQFEAARDTIYSAFVSSTSTAASKISALQAVAASKDTILLSIINDSIDDLIQSLCLSVTAEDVCKKLEEIQCEISKMTSQAKTSAALKINDALQSISINLGVRDAIWKKGILSSSTDVSGGNYGTYGTGIANGTNGKSGNPGKAEFMPYKQISDILLAKLFPVVHPDQCIMLLQKAKILYFTADPAENKQVYADAAIILNRLVDRTKAFQNDDLKDWYTGLESDLGTVNSIDSMRNTYHEAVSLINQLKNGQDFYGHKNNDVPLASFSFYNDLLNKLLDILEKVENSYNEYFQNLNDYTKAVSSIKSARNSAEDLIAQANIKIQLLAAQADQLVTEIDYLQGQVTGLKKSVIDSVKAVEEDISTACGYDVNDFISAISTCAFAPESGLIIVDQVFDFVNKSTTSIDADDGTKLRKDYIVSKVKSVSSDIDSLKEGFSELDDGTLQPDDPSANKLITDKAALESTLNQFYLKFPEDIKAVKDALSNYLNIILNRNNFILNYNAIISVLVSQQKMVKTNTQRISDFNDEILDKLQPELPALTSFMSKLYHDTRSQVMYELYMAARAFRFWALSDENIIADTFATNPPAKIISGMLRSSQSRILQAYAGAIEKRRKSAESFPYEGNKGIVYKLPSDYLGDYLEQLKMKNEIYFDIPAALKNTKKSENPFAGFADVRLMKVRPRIIGAKTGDNELRVDIIHTGNEDIVDSSGTVYNFSHQPVPTTFIYNLDTNQIKEDGDIGQKDDTSIYEMVGPFTNWRLVVNPDWNNNLDLSNVTDIEIEFCGTNYSFNT